MPIKSVPIKLDKQRSLRFDFNAFCVIEEQLNIPIVKFTKIFVNSYECPKCGFKTDSTKLPKEKEVPAGTEEETKVLCPECKEEMEIIDTIRFSDLRKVLWAGLLHEDKDLTLEKVGEILSEGAWVAKMADLAAKIAEALSVAFPDAEKEKDEAKNS